MTIQCNIWKDEAEAAKRIKTKISKDYRNLAMPLVEKAIAQAKNDAFFSEKLRLRLLRKTDWSSH